MPNSYSSYSDYTAYKNCCKSLIGIQGPQGLALSIPPPQRLIITDNFAPPLLPPGPTPIITNWSGAVAAGCDASGLFLAGYDYSGSGAIVMNGIQGLVERKISGGLLLWDRLDDKSYYINDISGVCP